MRDLTAVLRGLLLILAGAALGTAAGEVLLGALGLPAFPKEKALEHTGGLVWYRSALGGYPMHRLAPGSTYTHLYSSNPRSYFDARNGITIAANSRGFRGPECGGAREPGTLRIAFLGDSITLGEGVKFDDTYPELISAALGSAPDGKVRVVSCNYGMLAYNTTQEYLILVEEALAAQPDVVVMGYFLNDADGPFAEGDPATGAVTVTGVNPFSAGVTDRPPEGLLYRLRAARLLWQLRQQRRVTARTLSYYEDLYSDRNPHLARNMESLRLTIELCASRRIPLVIACIPVLDELGADHPLRPIHRRIGELVRGGSRGTATFVDLLPRFQGRDPRTLWVHETDHHPNERAHRVIADALLDAVRQGLGIPAGAAEGTATARP